MKIIAGIDGGGTGTILELTDLSGNPLKRERFGPFNLNSIGRERFEQLLTEIFKAINTAGECSAICIGAAGISNPSVNRIVGETAERYGLSGRLILRGDHEIALYGATGGGPGIILIAGTGSVCVGMNNAFKTVRSGGWGHLIDDEGSGYTLGRDALTAVVQAFDGRQKETVLTELIFRQLSVPDIGGLIHYVYGTADKSHIAALAPLVEEAGRMGDEAALRILNQNGEALARLVEAVYHQLKMEEISLSLLGGLLIHDTLLKETALQAINILLPAIHMEAPKMDAACGAALLALSTYRAPL